jgi:hypothetical protein
MGSNLTCNTPSLICSAQPIASADHGDDRVRCAELVPQGFNVVRTTVVNGSVCSSHTRLSKSSALTSSPSAAIGSVTLVRRYRTFGLIAVAVALTGFRNQAAHPVASQSDRLLIEVEVAAVLGLPLLANPRSNTPAGGAK